jgi:hypothetical protein
MVCTAGDAEYLDEVSNRLGIQTKSACSASFMRRRLRMTAATSAQI